jgi:FtsZ-interacting cell division protein ZipA
MPAWAWVIIAIVIIAAVAFAVWTAMRKRRTNTLRQQFGPEYDRTVDETGDAREAESELERRRRRRADLDIRPIASDARQRYADEWRAVQARFVDDPGGSVGEADSLVTRVMRDRGYPMDDFDQRAADVSVDHPEVVIDYRSAHDISTRSAKGQANGQTETEDLRQAMVHYRALFEILLEDDSGEDVSQAT